MTSLALILLLTFLPAEYARGKYLPKASSNPVFGPRQVYGLLNGSVTVTCFYPPSRVNRHDRKYWCKESATGCLTVTSTSGYTAPGYRGRASITDNPQEENFQISISELTMADAGTYQCGVGINSRRLTHKVNLDVSKDSHIPEGAELFYVKLHSTLAMTCNFGNDYESMRKFLCKMSKTGCVNIIDSYGNIDEDYRGRALLSNTEAPGSFSIMITHMTWEDSGLYLCGVGVYGQSGETKELDVHVYEETNDPQVKPTIFGVKGSSATFECHYKPLKGTSVNYWCKWRQNGCSRIIDNSGYVSGLYEGRVAMYESPDNQTITIILNQLKDSDEGYYWCMTNEVEEQQSSTELKIVDGQPGLQGKEEVEAQEGSQLNLTCSYQCRYYSYQKYWCKWSSTSCTPLPASDQRQPGSEVTCDTDDKTVILSFDSVAKTDQGWYWCGVKRNGRYGETMAVYLSVTSGESARHSPESLDAGAHSPESLDAGVHSPESLDADVPSLVKAPSPAEGGVIPQGRINDAASESPNQSGPNTLLLVLAPVGAVLLIITTAFGVFKYRQLKRSDLVSIGSYRTNISMSDFESIKDYGVTNNSCVKETQETRIGGDEFITTAATPESAAETKKAKRSSKKDADLTYSAFLTSSSIVQGSSGEHAAAPHVFPRI
ncbi:PREDICTED: polymeric immunoglobulin receptor-like [Nestor notabilis]|uniref:polymeric immunoglobulin receptor-like n=1 Tax=Nestor notabilis TaxID=176057 RepID=UPI000523C54A|nr:PREDICTED: polymeric immunoglobulin receptor-like [Nestor notabilis]